MKENREEVLRCLLWPALIALEQLLLHILLPGKSRTEVIGNLMPRRTCIKFNFFVVPRATNFRLVPVHHSFHLTNPGEWSRKGSED